MSKKITKHELDISLIQEIEKYQEIQELDDKIGILSNEILSNKESISLNLKRGEQVISVDSDNTAQFVSLEGKTIINHLPLFDSGLWSLHEKAKIISPSKLTLTATASSEYSSFTLLVKPNKTYTISMKRKGRIDIQGWTTAYVERYYQDAVNANAEGYMTATFTTGGTVTNLLVMLSNVNAGTFIFEDIMLNDGSEAQEFVANVKGITNPSIKVQSGNLIKPITDSDLHSNAKKLSDYSFVINSETEQGDLTKIEVECAKNTTYTFSSDVEDGTFFDILLRNADDEYTYLHTLNSDERKPFIFTSKADSEVIVFNMYSSLGEHHFKNFMLVKGSVVTSFKPYSEEYLTLINTFHEGDTVYVDGNRQVRVNRKRKEVVLDGGLDWTFHVTENGIKTVKIPLSTAVDQNVLVTKYNGKILNSVLYTSMVDNAYMHSNGYTYISIPNTDSGWGENYIPTATEIKAYFMGWRMLSWATGLLYEGTGTKGWAKIKGDSGIKDSQLNLPIEPHNDLDWHPYRLIYELATPVDESVHTIGSLLLQKGENKIEVSEGKIVRERANPKQNTTSKEWHINILNGASDFVPNGAQLNFKASIISNVYKNGKQFGKYEKLTTMAYGSERLYIQDADFDPTAIYEVDYIPLELYKVSAPANSLSIKYQSKLGSVVAETVDNVSNLNHRVGVNEGLMTSAFKGETVLARKIQDNWKTAVLQNGWSGTVKYRKNEIGQLEVALTLTSGTVNSLTIISTLEYKVLNNTIITALRTVDGQNINGAFYIDTSGSMRIPFGVTLTTATNYQGTVIAPLKES